MDTDEPKEKQQPKEEQQTKEQTKYIKPETKKSTKYTDIDFKVKQGNVYSFVEEDYLIFGI